MPASAANLESLRQLLADRFPTAVRGAGTVLRTEVPAVDEALGGVPCGALTEVVCASASCGSHLLIGQLLQVVRGQGGRAALIDAHDSFDPQSWSEDALRHLVWARCAGTAMALQVADILAREANLQLVVLDLRRAGQVELRRTPAPFWYRLQRAVEPADLALLVLTPGATVPSARLRLQLDRAAPFAALEVARPLLATALAPSVQRQRLTASA